MTDLERADALLYALLTEDDAPRQEAMLARALAVSRREGAEEMRERAAQVADEMAAHYEKRSRYTPVELDIGAVSGCEAVADAIRALPLTPEEPI